MTPGDAHHDDGAVVFVAEPVVDSPHSEPRRRGRRWITGFMAAAIAVVATVVLLHRTEDRPTAPTAARAPTHVSSALCPTTCESSNGTAHVRAAITAAIEDAFDRATRVGVSTLTSTVVPGTERTLLRRSVTATVPEGPLTVIVSTSPAGGSPFGEAPVTTMSATTARAVVDDYYVSATVQASPRSTGLVDARLRQLVHDARLVEQR